MTADVLSDVLRAVRLTGAVYFNFDLTTPWVAATPPASELVGTVMPGAERVIMYHLVARGTCWSALEGEPPMRVREGDLIVFPQGDPHVLSSAPGMRTAPDMAPYASLTTPLPIAYELGGGGAEGVRLICGFFGCDERPYNPLLGALPRFIHLTSAASDPQSGWLSTLMHTAATESGRQRAGGENVLSRLSELMFVEIIRRHIDQMPPSQTGWLAGVRDPLVGRALSAMHAAPRDAWTVESLARFVGASRSVFAERFTGMVGQPPMQYLALWRMQLASRLLDNGRTVADVAEAVGYESEAAFSRAFKKLVGQSPASWRKRANAA